MRTADGLFWMPGLHYALVAFLSASTSCACSRLAKRRSTIEGGELAPEAGQQKDLPAILFLSATIVLPPHPLTHTAHFRKN
uniref:Putative secreted protein n=1 Tax=Ixodes ricinus TaxID=34613 RepID=A0A6B0U877_IXORI